MIIKSFTAESAAAALKKVRSEMGGEAVVLKTRKIDGPGNNRVEITACLDKVSVARASVILPEQKNHLKSDAQKSHTVPTRFETTDSASNVLDRGISYRLTMIENTLEKLTGAIAFGKGNCFEDGDIGEIEAKLRRADISESYLVSLREKFDEEKQGTDKTETKAREILKTDLAQLLTSGINLKNGDQVVFLGWPASGKTSVMGKMAAHLVMQNKKVKLLSLDNLKVGAYEEISSYADLLGLEHDNLFDTEIKKNQADKILLIDTPFISNREDKLKELQAGVEALKPTYRLLVISALTRSSDIMELLDTFKIFKPSHLVLTMTDMTRRLGVAVSTCHQLGIKLAYVTDGPGGIGRLELPDVDSLLSSLLNEEVAIASA